jgi:ABC-2 type transport system ATP-binding protein
VKRVCNNIKLRTVNRKEKMAQKSSGNSTYAIEVSNLEKSYKDLKVLQGISFSVKRGTVLALLGPNGAGKTTTIKILSTLLLPDSGHALVNGFNVVRQEAGARASIGLTGQYAAVDGYLSAEENLFMVGRLYRMSSEQAKARTDELIKQFDLVDASKRPVKTFSGGMRRRLDLAMSLIASPPIIFLDEPTTGLDPKSRLTMWEMVKKLVDSGTTILLTTQYMEEADQLADEIVVIDGGKVIAEGTPDSLKAKVGSDRLELTISRGSSFKKAEEVIDGDNLQAEEDRRVLSVATRGGVAELKKLLKKLDDANIEVESIELRRPTLDDVFLTLTGHVATEATEELDDNKKKGGKNE